MSNPREIHTFIKANGVFNLGPFRCNFGERVRVRRDYVERDET